jgi:hypothetical protein
VIDGYFGSLCGHALTFITRGGLWHYLVLVEDEILQWHLYCTEAKLAPTHGGELTDVECAGQKYRFRCWRLNAANYLPEANLIASTIAPYHHA